MGCDQIKELLLTDYIDGCLSPEIKRTVDEHLNNCPSCAEFKQTVIQTSVVPFNEVDRKDVPADVWSKIESSLEHKQETEPKTISWWESLQSLVFKPAPVGAFIVIFFLIASVTLNQRNLRQAKLNSQSKEFLVSVMNASSSVLISDDDGYGTSLEQVFL